MLADLVEFVIGVDTHKDRHSAALVAANGGQLDALDVPASGAGYRQLLKWVEERADGPRAWAIEGTGSYGAGLTRHLQERSEWVIEADRPTRPARRKGGAKSDAIDAVRAAREALSRDSFGSPRQGGLRGALQGLQTTREGVMKARTKAINQLHAQVVEAPEKLRASLRELSGHKLVERCVRLRATSRQDREWRIYVDLLRGIAKRIQDLEAEAKGYLRQIDELTQSTAPELRAEKGVGPTTAAQVLVAYSHPGRVRSEAAFASLAGACPIEASSGQQTRHRLNPGGDRQLNRALHTVAKSRMKHDERTRAYVARRCQEGKNERETRRCLKRYLARHLYRLLERAGREQMFEISQEFAA